MNSVNWLAGPCPLKGLACRIKLRSTQPAAPGRVFLHQDGRGEVALDTPQLGVSPGQAAVFYDDTRVLGGGWITDTKLARQAASGESLGKTRAAVPHLEPEQLGY
jgi:tRNA-specific 2-thiouridylase